MGTTAIGLRLTVIRESRHMTQSELATEIGVSKGTIAHYERGRATINTARLDQLSRALHCPLTGLLERPEAPVPRISFRGGPRRNGAPVFLGTEEED